MDATHRPDDMGFISQVVNVRAFYENAMHIYMSDKELDTMTWDPEVHLSSQFASKLDVDQRVIEELECIFNPVSLSCGMEDDADPLSSFIPQNDLVSLRVQATELEHRTDGSKYRQYVMESWKYKKLNFAEPPSPSVSLNKLGYIPDDVVMTMILLKPRNKELDSYQIQLGRLLSMDCVYEVRGSLPLSSLCNIIKCSADLAVSKDYSECPNQVEHAIAQDKYPSRFIFINDTFYNDMSHPKAIDYSKEIIDWCKRKGTTVGPFKSKDVDGVTFLDLTLRLGQPYLYMHQGNCEHLIIFTHLRLRHAEDPDVQYPVQISKKFGKRAACATCKRFTAKWIIHGDDSLPFESLFQCEECFRAFNYDKEGKKLRDFKCVPYFDKSAMHI